MPAGPCGPGAPLGTLRVSFGIFAAVLLPVSLRLIGQASVIFPWPLNPRSSVIYGLIFLGAVTYFLPGVFRPRWGNATGQLLGFLAYDLVLIGPFLQHYAVVKPEHRASLIVYTVVLVYSGTLAVYYLFINPQTRFLAARELPPPVELRPAHA